MVSLRRIPMHCSGDTHIRVDRGHSRCGMQGNIHILYDDGTVCYSTIHRGRGIGVPAVLRISGILDRVFRNIYGTHGSFSLHICDTPCRTSPIYEALCRAPDVVCYTRSCAAPGDLFPVAVRWLPIRCPP